MPRYSSAPERYEGHSRLRLWLDGAVEELKSIPWRRRAAPAKRFCLYAQGRTGSTLVTSSLDSHPDIVCPDEILRRPKLDALRYVDAVARRHGAHCFGFHVKCRQISRFYSATRQRDFLRRLHAEDWALIHLRREDVVAHAFSNVFARHAGRYHFWEDGGARPDEPFVVSPDKFVRRVRHRLEWDRLEEEALSGLPVFRMSYERDLAEPDTRATKLAELLDWLQLPRAPLATSLSKSVRRDPWAMIANADELRRALNAAGLRDLAVTAI